ncbi:MAG: protein-L-isoaspartate O-methyltransferase family protein [Candidatus Puniceispirillaceae bacterium]
MNDMHFEALRKAMVDSQIRPNKVIDDRVIAAFMSVPRERFVSKNMQNLAYIDEDIHLSGGRFIVEAMVMARIIQTLALDASQSVMLIGAGTGYTAALLSSLVESVIAIETRAQMVEKAQQAVTALDIGNVAVIKARLQDGYASEAPYDAIIIEGAVEQMPQSLLDQLADGGRLAAIWRPDGTQAGEACIWHKIGDAVTRTALFTAQVPVLDEFRAKPKFSF